MRFAVSRLAFFDDKRVVPAAVGAEEVVTLGVVTSQRFGAGEVGEMVAAFAVFGFVINDFIDDLNLSDRVIALEVGGRYTFDTDRSTLQPKSV